MIKETGRVVAIESDCLWVETIRQSTCGSCSLQKGCGHRLLNNVGTGRSHHLRVLLQGLPASSFVTDDEVDVCIPESVLVKGALFVYLLPLVSLLFGAMLVSQWWSGDVAALIGAVIGFLVGIGLVKYHAVRNQNNIHLQPVVMAKNSTVDNISIPAAGSSF